MRAPTRPDRRVNRTRALLLASFDRLFLTRGYNDVRVRGLTANADVGRSTFYEHFEGKEELLEHSVARVMTQLAATTASGAFEDALIHVCTQRSLAGELMQGSARAIVVRVLARKLEAYLTDDARRSAAVPIAPLPFLAVSLAHAQLEAVDAWLSDDGSCDARTAAPVLKAPHVLPWQQCFTRAAGADASGSVTASLRAGVPGMRDCMTTVRSRAVNSRPDARRLLGRRLRSMRDVLGAMLAPAAGRTIAAFAQCPGPRSPFVSA